jgi:death on curing protein
MSFIDGLIHLSAVEIQDLHDSILDELPGLKGSRSDLSVHALTGRIHHNLTYEVFDSIEQVAALYAEVISRGHVFNDGNKRTALLSMLTFLDLNGFLLEADQNELADKFVSISNGHLTHRTFSLWLKGRVLKN